MKKKKESWVSAAHPIKTKQVQFRKHEVGGLLVSFQLTGQRKRFNVISPFSNFI